MVWVMEFTIDCRACTRPKSDNWDECCDDCVVTYLTSQHPNEAVVVDAAEFAAMRRLAAAGLIRSPLEGHRAPPSRLRRAG